MTAIVRIATDLLVEEWTFVDQALMFRQMGLA
jgi:hypothetical protein